uniref:Uncharacterized protein n=1 Tax=Arundo donax TaxID=35708 RepID=A0A0A8YEI4_ARUDO
MYLCSLIKSRPVFEP